MGDVVVTDEREVVVVDRPQRDVVVAFMGPPGPTGPQGVPGPPGGEIEFQAPAAENLSAGRAVVMLSGQLYYFQPGTPSHAGALAGVTITAVVAPALATVKSVGVHQDAAYTALSAGPVFAGVDGELFNSPPLTGTVQQVGTIVDTGSLLINPTVSFIRSP